MLASPYSNTLNTAQRHHSTHTQAPTLHYAPTASKYTRATYSSNAKEAEYLADQASMQAQSKTKLQETLVGYGYIEPSQHRRPSDIDLKMPSETRSDIFSPIIPTSPLPQYSYPPQYSPPRLSKQLPREPSPEPRRRTSTRPVSRPVSPPPRYHREPEPKVGTFNCNNIYSGGKSQAMGKTLPSSRSKAIDGIDCRSMHSLVESHGIDRTPQKPGRLALAASRECRSAKKQFESHKRQTRNQVVKRTEGLGLDGEVDDFAMGLLEDIAAIGALGCETTRAAFEHAFVMA